MALFADGPASTIDSLTDQDSGLLDVAQTNGINVTTKLRLAHEEIGTELQLWLLRPRPTLELLWGPTLRLEQVVVTAPLKRWETLRALALVYRDAYFSQLVDRYQAKWQEFLKLARDAYEEFIATGLGLVSDPIRRAQIPALGSTPGPQSGGTFYASVSWVNAEDQEGACVRGGFDHDSRWKSDAGDAPDRTGKRGRLQDLCGDITLPDVSANQRPSSCERHLHLCARSGHARAAPGFGQTPDYTRPLVRTLLRG